MYAYILLIGAPVYSSYYGYCLCVWLNIQSLVGYKLFWSCGRWVNNEKALCALGVNGVCCELCLLLFRLVSVLLCSVGGLA